MRRPHLLALASSAANPALIDGVVIKGNELAINITTDAVNGTSGDERRGHRGTSRLFQLHRSRSCGPSLHSDINNYAVRKVTAATDVNYLAKTSAPVKVATSAP